MDIINFPIKKPLEAQALIEVVNQHNSIQIEKRNTIRCSFLKPGGKPTDDYTEATNVMVYLPGYGSQAGFELGRALERELLRRSLLEPID